MGQAEGRLGILVGGGPAPGINGVISAVTLEARNRGCEVMGLYDGFAWLMKGETSRVKLLDHDEVSRIHFQGGSILNTSRANPTRRPEDLERVVASLEALNIRYLVTIGGDDTMYAASRVATQAGGRLRVCHVPKTIDNDLPLPDEMPTFGFETARQLLFELLRNLMEDSRTTNRWYFVVVMGRSAGHLALHSGMAAGATTIIIPEEFPGIVHLETLADVLEGAIVKRRAFWQRRDGVAVIAEGLLERIPEEELERIQGVRLTRDEYGHLRLAEMDLAHILKTVVEQRFAERGDALTIVHKTIGYEVRSAPPIASDCQYVKMLGYGAVEFLLNPTPDQAQQPGALVCVANGRLQYLPFDRLMDPQTGRTRIRVVDVTTPMYRIAREYMIRLEREDLEDERRLAELARAASTKQRPMTPEEFRKRFQHVVTELIGGV